MATKLGSPDEMPAMLDLTEKDLPQLKDWKVGGHYRVILELQQVSQHQGGYPDGKGPMRASFKVTSAKSAGETKAPAEQPKVLGKNPKVDVVKEKAAKY